MLIANGDAIVGNLGGYDSSIEITALGSPVNLLSRIDEITKLPRFREVVRESDLVFCPTTAHLFGSLGTGMHDDLPRTKRHSGPESVTLKRCALCGYCPRQ